MKRAANKIPNIFEKELNIDKFLGLNTFGPHADDAPGQFRVLTNFDNYGRYIKERRGSINLSVGVNIPDYDILEYIIFDAGDDEYAVVQFDDGFQDSFLMAVNLSGIDYYTWYEIYIKNTFSIYKLGHSDKVKMMASNGKIYLFSQTGANAILEFDSSISGFTARRMGLPALQIAEVTTNAGFLKGKRVYGAELVYKDTMVTPEVDIIVSGPNRALAVDNPLFGEGRLAYTEEVDFDAGFNVKISSILNDGTLITDTENNWTHARLYRSKDITTATNAAQDLEGESEITGRPDELFQVQEMTREDFLATLDGDGFYWFNFDIVEDDDMPFPLAMVTESRLELIPMPAASIGVFHANRIWVAGVLGLAGPGGIVSEPEIQSKIFYTPESDTKYSESIRPLNAIESDPGDGQKMIDLYPFREDLLGIKESKTGVVRNGNPDNGWVTEDEVIGISNRGNAQYVPDIGICAKVNDQSDFRIFGYNLQWTNILAGQRISRPIRNIIKGYTGANLSFIYINGKLMISGGEGEMLVLATEQQSGWSKYVYPLGSKSTAVITFAQGTRALILNRNQPIVEIEAVDENGDYITTDYRTIDSSNQNIPVYVTTYKFQDNGGRSLIEERFISIVAAASNPFILQSYVNGKQWMGPFQSILNPNDYVDDALKETEYQAYQEYRAIGNYIHYEISSYAPCTIYSIMLNALIQRGSIRPGFDPFEQLGSANTFPSWIDTGLGNLVETGTAVDTISETGTAPNTITEEGTNG